MHVKRRSFLFAAGGAVLLLLLLNGGIRTIVRRYWEIHTLTRDLEQLKRENRYLRREIYSLEHDPSYIERMARRELGLVAPEEVEYRFTKK